MDKFQKRNSSKYNILDETLGKCMRGVWLRILGCGGNHVLDIVNTIMIILMP
jgi:hypothetical protein